MFTGEIMANGHFNKVDILQYIEDMLRNMQAMIKTADCQVLVYLLEMAIIESREQIEAEEKLATGVVSAKI